MNLKRTNHFLFTGLFFISSLLTGCTGQVSKEHYQVPATDCISKGWPHDYSDLKPDPSLVFGTLENGIRYVIKINHEPKNRVGMYLNIQAGSLHETEEQRGLAHYLEHMLFNGTTHYPPGTLVEYFQSIGMGFGADTNAHTTYDETVYKLLLPGGDRTNLDEGMLVLADYARGALLLEKEVTDPPFTEGDAAIALVNSMGGTPVSELYIAYRKLMEVCKAKGISIVRNLIGHYITALEMQGLSITLLKINNEILKFWDAPVKTPGLRWGV